MLNKVIMMIAALAICASSITLTGCEDPEAKAEAKAKAEKKAKIEKQIHDFGKMSNEDIKNQINDIIGDVKGPEPITNKKKDAAEEK